MKNWIVLILLALSFSTSLHAKEQRLLTVTSDGLDGTLDLSAFVDSEDRAVKLILTKREDRNYRREFPAAELKRGIVILEISGQNVVILRSGDFDLTRGGHVVVDYLSSGVTKSRQQMELEVEHDGRSWVVLHRGGKITSMFMKARTLFGKTVGISGVQMK